MPSSLYGVFSGSKLTYVGVREKKDRVNFFGAFKGVISGKDKLEDDQ